MVGNQTFTEILHFFQVNSKSKVIPLIINVRAWKHINVKLTAARAKLKCSVRGNGLSFLLFMF